MITVRSNKETRTKYGNKIIINLFVLFLLLGFSTTNAQIVGDESDKFLGSALGNNIFSNYTNYWNQVTPENAGKWGSVESSRDSYNWTQLDNLYNYAKENNLIYKHHVLVWGSQQPNWITSLSIEEQREEIEEWFQLVGERYPEMDWVEVVNEPLHAVPNYKEALGGDGATGWDWIITSFELARKYINPNAKLMINEYSVLGSNENTNTYLEIINLLIERDLIDGIGVQGHYFEFRSPEGSSPSYSYPVSTIKSNLNKLIATELPFYLTEHEINEENDETQLKYFKLYFPIFWYNPGVKGITFWGYVENHMWKANGYLLSEPRYDERLAMEWLKQFVYAPVPPELLSPANGETVSRNPIFTWETSETATSYNVEISKNVSFSTLTLDTTLIDTTFEMETLLSANGRFYWRVSANNEFGEGGYSSSGAFRTNSDITDIEESISILDDYKLEQNYPNPFNPTTTVSFSIPKHNYVKLVVVDLLGKELMTIAEGDFSAGSHSIKFDASQLASGIYLYRIEAGAYISTRKMVLLK